MFRPINPTRLGMGLGSGCLGVIFLPPDDPGLASRARTAAAATRKWGGSTARTGWRERELGIDVNCRGVPEVYYPKVVWYFDSWYSMDVGTLWSHTKIKIDGVRVFMYCTMRSTLNRLSNRPWGSWYIRFCCLPKLDFFLPCMDATLYFTPSQCWHLRQPLHLRKLWSANMKPQNGDFLLLNGSNFRSYSVLVFIHKCVRLYESWTNHGYLEKVSGKREKQFWNVSADDAKGDSTNSGSQLCSFAHLDRSSCWRVEGYVYYRAELHHLCWEMGYVSPMAGHVYLRWKWQVERGSMNRLCMYICIPRTLMTLVLTFKIQAIWGSRYIKADGFLDSLRQPKEFNILS